jgi:TfoX/Sxy family transcriptional regulator of competence genes
MGYDPGLAARVADALEQIGMRSARQKNVFGGRGFLLGSRAFAIVWNDDLIVKLAPHDVQIALTEPGVAPFEPDGETPSRRWVVVAADAIADDPQLMAWLRRSLQSGAG